MATRALPVLLLSALLCLPSFAASAQAKKKKAAAKKTGAKKKGRARAGKRAAKGAGLQARLAKLRARIDAVAQTAADVPVALKALQDLHNRVTALSKQLSASKTRQRSYKALRDKTDSFEERVGDLELRVAALSLQVARRGASAGDGGNAGFDKGFYIRSGNRKFMLRVGTLLQIGYRGMIYGDSVQYAGTDLGQDDSTFLLRRARVRLRGHIYNPKLTYNVELDFGDADAPATPLLVLSGNLRIYRGLQVSAGRMKVPFGRGFQVHSSEVQFVERSGVVDAFAPRWDLGVMVHGDLLRRRMLSYQLGIFNGATPGATRDDNTDFMYAARLLFSPLGKVKLGEGDRERSSLHVTIGASFLFNLVPTDVVAREGITDPVLARAKRDGDGDGNVDNVGVYTAALELAARWRGFALQGELYYRVEDAGAVEKDNRIFRGAYGQLSYFFARASLEVAGRFGSYEDPGYGTDGTVARPNRIHELSFVIVGLHLGRLVKWQAEYTHKWLRDIAVTAPGTAAPAPTELTLHQIRLQLQLAF